MFTKVLKSIMDFNESERLAPRFLLTYLIIWCLWHSQIFTTFIMTNGDFFTRSDAAMLAMESNQYILVLFLTCLFFAGRIAYFVLKHKADEMLEKDSEADLQGGSDQRFAKADDVQRLMTMISTLKAKLADSQDREDKANNDRKTAINKQLSLQSKIDDMAADIALLNKSNEELKLQLMTAKNQSQSAFELS
ncbi:hypothetical protein FM038_019610 [Shewanella eurypsychrophilus]|uniref:Uncharacterized protein n=1 Tax=Shewanella eurypsychrophilus TaxID=2593656 RepID=A0ABX6V9I9_9GAMM|nr:MULTISPECIES: hypothetical protein [Shewanella]QFU24136.1 hypothetical protein FS418_21335 [Shewanella sp. YLB-09]QPG59343.1 hypothetical protein FM038_019610 [Shewanella eurypsychrophilus]